MKRVGAIVAAACLVMSAAIATGGPAEATSKKFRDVTVKVMQEPAPDREDRVTPIAVLCVGFVRWDSSTIDRSCPSYAGAPEFEPSVRSFKVTFRWFAGRSVIQKKARTITNHTHPILEAAPTRFLKASSLASSGAWRWKGKPLSLTVTLAKKGYATKVIRVANKSFTNVDD